jgi:hypothetical protein
LVPRQEKLQDRQNRRVRLSRIVLPVSGVVLDRHLESSSARWDLAVEVW